VKPPSIRRVGVVARFASREAVRTAAELADWLKRRNIAVELDEACLRARNLTDVAPFDPATRYDLAVVLGGDGTLLSVARTVLPGVPLLGVNLGRLGFLTEMSRSELYPTLLRILAGDFEIEERSLFDVELRRADGVHSSRYRAFNDAVIAKSALARIIELTIQINGRLMAQVRADGLIVSTPNGSTAYNLSAGGPILYPALPVAVLTPICPHTLSLRPIVVPDQATIEVTLETEQEVFLSVDGQEGSGISYHDTVRVTRAEAPVHLVRMRDRSFYDSLRDKLKWGG